jgi:thioesterase domain-containing protein
VSVSDFLAELRSRDIHVGIDGDRLRCNAPAGMLTPELREQLRQRKSEILDFLRTAESLTRQQRAIVPMQPRGTRTPVFAVPGHNGDIFAYRDLARHVGDDQPFFGLHPPGLDGNSEPLARVEDFAAYFADQIQAFRPSGPCIIAGYCAGGAVALELAQELARRGTSVSFLALFGCIYPTSYRFLAQMPYWWRRIGLHLQVVAKPASFTERCQYLAARLSARLKSFRALRSPSGTDPLSAMKFRFEHAHGKAVLRYTPQRFSGRVCMFLPYRGWPQSGDDALRWRDAVRGWYSVAPHAEAYYGPDSCDPDRMLVDPDAPAFAELFRRCRDKSSTEVAA